MNFITIDFETATQNRNSAIAIGLVKYRNYVPVDSYYSLIRPPELYILPEFTEIHGLTVEDVKDAPVFKDLWDSKIMPFIGELPLAAPLAAHNAVFDMGVLRAVLKWYKIPVPELSYFCTCNLARRTWPRFKSHALSALAGKFGIVYNAHNALDDAMTCGKLVELSAQKFGKRKSIKGLLRAAGIEMNVL